MHLNFLKLNKQHSYVLAIALLQSVALLGMHHWVQSLPKTGEYLVWILPLYLFIIFTPLSLMLLAHTAKKRAILLSLAFAVVIMLSAAHIGYIDYVPSLQRESFAIFIFSVCVFVVWFIWQAFAEHFCDHGSWCQHYKALHDFAWRNTIKLLTAGLFVGLFWAALALLAGLFKILNIDFFADLISNRYFAYPATTLSFGLGLSLYAAKEEALSEFKRATLQVLGWLLPLVSLILIGFATALLFTGLSTLWSTGYATNLMLCLMGLMVLLFNAAFQEGNQPEYPAWFLKLTQLGLVAMPIYSLLSLYAIYLRTQQYGWTADRVWALALVVLVSLYAWGYALGALQSFKRQNPWMSLAKRVNIFAAFATMSLLIALHSPLLNPARIAVESQVHRLLAGKISAEVFDYSYLRFEGRRYGDQALQALSHNQQHADAATIREKAGATLKQAYASFNSPAVANPTAFKSAFSLYPAGAQLQNNLLQAIQQKHQEDQRYQACFNNNDSYREKCHILMIDLNQDHLTEAVVSNIYGMRDVYQQQGQTWQFLGQMAILGQPHYSEPINKNAVEQGDYKTIAPTWKILQIGKQQFLYHPCCDTTQPSVKPNP